MILGGSGVPESTENNLKSRNKHLLLSKKFQNFDYFKHLSFKIKNTLRGVYTHPLQSIAPIRNVQEFHQGIRIISASVLGQLHFWSNLT